MQTEVGGGMINEMKKYDLEPLIEQETISSKIAEIGKMLDEHYDGEELTIIMVMKGAICLVADLIRNIHVPCSIEFVQAMSYGAKGMERGELTVIGLEKIPIKNRHVLLVDDIYDSGTTLTVILEAIKRENPKSLQSLVLLCKDVPRKTTYVPDYVLFSIENRFVVGYGLDYKEHYRGLSGVFVLVPKQS